MQQGYTVGIKIDFSSGMKKHTNSISPQNTFGSTQYSRSESVSIIDWNFKILKQGYES